MAVVMRMSWPEVTAEQYDKVREIVDWETSPEPGGLFHVAFFDEGGFTAIDVWESPEAFQTFVDNRLMPGIEQAGGVDGEPTVTVTPAHSVFNPALASYPTHKVSPECRSAARRPPPSSRAKYVRTNGLDSDCMLVHRVISRFVFPPRVRSGSQTSTFGPARVPDDDPVSQVSSGKSIPEAHDARGFKAP